MKSRVRQRLVGKKLTAPATQTSVFRHNDEIQNNLALWNRKASLRKSYRIFHQLIANNLSPLSTGTVVELGSGIGNIKEVIPHCMRTDLFQNPWLDCVQNAYALSFESASVSNLILFDVFHHLRYPGTAFEEFYRVLMPQGRVLIFEPRISLLGRVVFGLFHDEPVAFRDPIEWMAPPSWMPDQIDYYAAQGNATRIFIRGEFSEKLANWRINKTLQLSAISYVATGGYSKPSLYPNAAYPLMRIADRIADRIPFLFATRFLVVMEKR
jgi:SAM-dependent methyltransferase